MTAPARQLRRVLDPRHQDADQQQAAVLARMGFFVVEDVAVPAVFRQHVVGVVTREPAAVTRYRASVDGEFATQLPFGGWLRCARTKALKLSMNSFSTTSAAFRVSAVPRR